MSSDETARSSEALWREVCVILSHHFMAGDGCVETINRLWRKDPFVTRPEMLPVLTERSLRVTRESWQLTELWRFIHERRLTRHAPGDQSPPIVLLRWSGTDYLLDGRRRINFWKRKGNPGPHAALVIHADDAV